MDSFVGEIRLFGGDYAPTDWQFCDGQLLSISGHEVLFAVLSNVYGGNGVSDFALPNLNGRLPIGVGQRPGNAAYVVGQTGGSESVQLAPAEIPSHTHGLQGTTQQATDNVPGRSSLLAKTVADVRTYNSMAAPGTGDANFSALAIGADGGGAPHANVMPCMGMRYIISMRGIYPTPS